MVGAVLLFHGVGEKVAVVQAQKTVVQPPRFIRDGIDVYMNVDDLCRELETQPTASVAQVAKGLRVWKASMLPPQPAAAAAPVKKKHKKR